MSESVSKLNVIVAGLNVQVYSSLPILTSSTAVAIIFLLHGRGSSAHGVERIAEAFVRGTSVEGHAKDLLVVTFDQRNHGSRVVSSQANNSWTDQPRNDRHAIDMYAIQRIAGTSRDVSYLIDFLPSFLFPNGERTISVWGVSGISLGGHSTWLALSSDPRLKIGIPVIGCPDYLKLMTSRAKESSITLEPPYLPDCLLSLIYKLDPVSFPYSSMDTSNPFLGKKILVLSGGQDKVVPWSAGREFVERLEVGTEGRKKSVVVEGAGHICTVEMVVEIVQFIKEEVLQLR